MKPLPGTLSPRKPRSFLHSCCLGIVMLWLGAGAARAQLAPGTIVLSNDWAGLSGSFSSNFSSWPGPRSFLTSDSGAAGVSGGTWVDAGATATNVGIAFQAGAGSPFPSPFTGGASPSAGLVVFGNTDGTGRNGPRLNSGIADIQNNPAGVYVQFDTKISDVYSGASLLSWYWPNNDQFGLHFGSSAEQQGVINVVLPSSTGGGVFSLMPYSPDVWYRIAIWTEDAWATASNYNVSVITFGGRTNVFAHLPMPDGVAEHGKPFGLEFHSGALGASPPDTPHGTWAIENVLVMIGKGTGWPGGKTDLKTASVAIPTLGQLFARVLALVGPAPTDAPKELELKPGDTIVAIGDSITQAGGYLRDIDTILAARYPDLKIPPIINAGVSGNKSEDLIRRFDADVMAHKPSIITISIGINDVWHRLAQPHDEQVLKGYKANVTKMVEEAQAAGIKVILLAPTVIQEDPQAEGNQRLVMYIEAERQIAAATGCQFVDLHHMFLNALKGIPRTATGNWLTQDGVHMNSLGDAIMAAGVLRALGVPDATITGN